MKKLVLFFALTILSLNFKAQPPVVYLDFVTHNEDVTTWGGTTYYNNNRGRLISLSNYFQTNGITWNMQSDWTYLTSVIQKDTGTVLATTNNKNILRWMYEDKGVEMDPHSHETTYIYPDIVKLLDSIGLPESKVMGGAIYNGANGINVWTNLINGQNGVIFPTKFWKPDYMMGGGTPGHVADIKYYGIWNPQSITAYLTHDPSNALRHIGVGCSIKIKNTTTADSVINAIKDVINNVQSGQHPSNGFYLQTIFFEQGDMNLLAFYNKVLQVADSANVLVASGKAQWKTLKQAYTIWETTYAAQMFQWDCGQLVGVEQQSIHGNSIKLFPNPNTGIFNLQIDNDLMQGEIVLLNSLGQEVHSQKAMRGKNSVEVTKLPHGFYYCILKEGSTILAQGKLLIE